MKEPVTVLIPDFYRPLTPTERYALTSIQAHLGDFPITFLKAKSENLWFELGEICPGADTVSYDDRYFDSRRSFAKLLLGSQLYEDFGWSRYLLMLEMNTLINQNELAHWCRQGYDFIQPAPQFIEEEGWLDATKRQLNPANFLQKHNDAILAYAQSSGISLRKVETFKKITRRKKRAIHHYLAEGPEVGNDAPFWEFHVNRWRPELLVPNQIGRDFFAKPYADAALKDQPASQLFAYTGLTDESVLPRFYDL